VLTVGSDVLKITPGTMKFNVELSDWTWYYEYTTRHPNSTPPEYTNDQAANIINIVNLPLFLVS